VFVQYQHVPFVKMTTATYPETLEPLQHTTWSNSEGRCRPEDVESSTQLSLNVRRRSQGACSPGTGGAEWAHSADLDAVKGKLSARAETGTNTRPG
jgi:hypothetical protein